MAEYLRCSGSRTICTSGYRTEGTNCVLIPVTSRPVVIAPTVNVPTARPCATVTWSADCDGTDFCCDASRGLTCVQRRTTKYRECRCASNTHFWDGATCRPRVYGSPCESDDQCGSGLVGSSGYQCREGYCRCTAGFEPYNNRYFNETSLTPYSWRICIHSKAINWVPTGQMCHMDPHRWSSTDGLRVCHSRAFCHLCAAGRASYSASSVAPIQGVCRELTCQDGGSCNEGNQMAQGTCNKGSAAMDPPCKNGWCDCNADNGFYKDRFSRCAAYRMLQLGDRCIVPDGTTQLVPLYVNNEDWSDDQVCVAPAMGTTLGGYAGYNWGVIKCKFPLIEDVDGKCTPNNLEQNIFAVNWLGYQAACDDDDTRHPYQKCNTAAGLVCRAGRCECGSTSGTTECSLNFGGCTPSSSSRSSVINWDAALGKCRAAMPTDQCRTASDCCGGVCNIQAGAEYGFCGCREGYKQISYSTTTMPNHGSNNIESPQLTTVTRCVKDDAVVVGKGQECMLPGKLSTWECGNRQYGYYRNQTVPLVCQQGLVCMRCPIDPEPFDTQHGICRQLGTVPNSHAAPPVVTGPGGIPIPTIPGIPTGPGGYPTFPGGMWGAASSVVASNGVLFAAIATLLAFLW